MRRQSGQGHHRQRQGGIALLTVLFALLLISGIAFGMMYMANTETIINSNFRDLQKAQYGAWSGIHEARARMITTLTTGATNANAIARPTAFPADTGATANMIYIVNPASGDTVNPSSGTYADTELCHEGFAGLSSLAPSSGTYTAGVPCSTYTKYPATTSYSTVNSNDPGRTTAYALPYKWVRITMKANASGGGDYLSAPFKVQPTSSSQTTPVCWNGYRQQLLPSGPATTCEAYVPTDPTTPYLTTVYVLTSLGVTPSGARRMVQMETAFNPPFQSNSAVASNDNVILNGALTVNGYDNCSCICYCTPHGGGSDYRVGPTGVCTNNNDTWDGCQQRNGVTCTSKWGIYAQGTIQNPTGANENVYSASTPAYSPNNTNFPYNPAALVQAYSALPGVKNVTSPPYNWTCSSTGCGTHSQSSDPVGTFGTYPTIDPSQAGFDAYTGSPTACPGPCSVFQITYIPGTSGGSTHLSGGWTGAGVLLVQGDLVVGGGLNFYGLIIVSGSVTFSGSGSDPTNIYGSIVSGQPVVDSTTGGGGMNVHYDSCALSNQFKGSPPTILASRELPY